MSGSQATSVVLKQESFNNDSLHKISDLDSLISSNNCSSDKLNNQNIFCLNDIASSLSSKSTFDKEGELSFPTTDNCSSSKNNSLQPKNLCDTNIKRNDAIYFKGFINCSDNDDKSLSPNSKLSTSSSKLFLNDNDYQKYNNMFINNSIQKIKPLVCQDNENTPKSNFCLSSFASSKRRKSIITDFLEKRDYSGIDNDCNKYDLTHINQNFLTNLFSPNKNNKSFCSSTNKTIPFIKSDCRKSKPFLKCLSSNGTSQSKSSVQEQLSASIFPIKNHNVKLLNELNVSAPVIKDIQPKSFIQVTNSSKLGVDDVNQTKHLIGNDASIICLNKDLFKYNCQLKLNKKKDSNDSNYKDNEKRISQIKSKISLYKSKLDDNFFAQIDKEQLKDDLLSEIKINDPNILNEIIFLKYLKSVDIKKLLVDNCERKKLLNLITNEDKNFSTNDLPIFSFNDLCRICDNVCKNREKTLLSQYITENSRLLSNQYEAFMNVSFSNQDYIRSSSDPMISRYIL